jgi:hypothetical protein
MAIILKANKVNLFVSSVLFVFLYHLPNFLDTMYNTTGWLHPKISFFLGFHLPIKHNNIFMDNAVDWLATGKTRKHLGLYYTGPLCAACFSFLHQLQGHPCCSPKHSGPLMGQPRTAQAEPSVSEGGKVGREMAD